MGAAASSGGNDNLLVALRDGYESVLPNVKSRWEEAEDVPYMSNSLWELQVQFENNPLDVIHAGVLSEQ
eukprot:gene6672-8532_t